MIEILKEYIKNYLVLSEDKAASARSQKSEDAPIAIKKINSLFKKEGQKLKIVRSAAQGKKDTDVQVVLIGNPSVPSDKVWNFEIKSFGANDEFSIEITNPSSLVRQIVLKKDSRIGGKEDREEQLRSKISSKKSAIDWAEKALSSPEASFWRGKLIIPGDSRPRGLSVISGDVGDWSRLRAIGGSGTPRDFYTISNYDLKEEEKEMFYTDELEKAIKDQFRQKNDEVLVIMGDDGSVRCFSLTSAAQKTFGFPRFYTGGDTLLPESTRLSSFGGGGRITTIVKVKPGRGFVIE